MKAQQKIFRLMNFQKIIQPVTGLNKVWLSFHPTKWNRVGLDSLNTLTTADSARDGYVTKPYKYEINRLCVPLAHSHTNFISVGLVYVWRHDINKSSINCSHLLLANQLNISVTQCMRFLALVLTHIPILNHECNRITTDFGYSTVRVLLVYVVRVLIIWITMQTHHSKKSLWKRVQLSFQAKTND